jgi:hypothetical protein
LFQQFQHEFWVISLAEEEVNPSIIGTSGDSGASTPSPSMITPTVSEIGLRSFRILHFRVCFDEGSVAGSGNSSGFWVIKKLSLLFIVVTNETALNSLHIQLLPLLIWHLYKGATTPHP